MYSLVLKTVQYLEKHANDMFHRRHIPRKSPFFRLGSSTSMEDSTREVVLISTEEEEDSLVKSGTSFAEWDAMESVEMDLR